MKQTPQPTIQKTNNFTPQFQIPSSQAQGNYFLSAQQMQPTQTMQPMQTLQQIQPMQPIQPMQTLQPIYMQQTTKNTQHLDCQTR